MSIVQDVGRNSEPWGKSNFCRNKLSEISRGIIGQIVEIHVIISAEANEWIPVRVESHSVVCDGMETMVAAEVTAEASGSPIHKLSNKHRLARAYNLYVKKRNLQAANGNKKKLQVVSSVESSLRFTGY